MSNDKIIKFTKVGFRPGKYKIVLGDFSPLESIMFERWLALKGLTEFEKWFHGMQRLKGTKCFYCDWCDPTNAQCFDGHIQRVGCPKQEGKNEV